MALRIVVIVWLSLLVGCENNSKINYSLEEICNCYNLKTSGQIDNRFNSCLGNFNSWLDTQGLNENQKTQVGKDKLFALTKKMIESCSKYQNDFNETILSRYETRKENVDLSKKGRITELVNNGINVPLNKSILAEYEIIIGNADRALELVNESIEVNSNIEIAYWIRGFLYHQNGEYDKAIEDCITLKRISKNKQMLEAVELWEINLKMEKKGG